MRDISDFSETPCFDQFFLHFLASVRTFPNLHESHFVWSGLYHLAMQLNLPP